MIGEILAALAIGFFIGGASDNQRYDKRSDKYDSYELERVALSDYNSKKQELISSFSSALAYDFKNNLDSNFCGEKINGQNENQLSTELNEYIEELFVNENKDNLFSSRINKSLEKLSKKMSEFEVKHLNILLVGPTGVGKSTLINSLLKLDEDKEVPADITKPTTKTFNVYDSNKISNIRLIDSRGIEKGDYNIDEFVNEVKNYIEKSELNGNPDNFVHCIWYCVTGTRFEDIEEKTLNKLASIYDDSKLPIIVIYTQAIIPQYYNAMREIIIKNNKNLEFIPVVAKSIKLLEGKIIKPYNLDKLLFASLEKAKNAVSSSVYSAIKKMVKNEINKENENNINKAKNILKENSPIKSDDLSILELYYETKYEHIFKTLLFEQNSHKELKEDSKTIIKDLVNKLKEKTKEIYGNCVSDFAEKRTEELISKLLDLQVKVNERHNGNLKEHKTSGQFKEEIFPPILNSLSVLIEDYGMNSLETKIIELIAGKIQNSLFSLIDSDSTKNNLNLKIKKQFQNILAAAKGFHF